MNIKINAEVLEMMLFFWQSTSEKEKVSDTYLSEIGARNEMKVLFSDSVNEESIRKVLSAITNREFLSEKTKEEGRFWNNNMWMLEDLSLTNMMLSPIKQLNPDQFLPYVKEDLEIIFIPGTFETVYKEEGKLYINFFKLQVNPYGDDMEPKIVGLTIEAFIIEQLKS